MWEIVVALLCFLVCWILVNPLTRWRYQSIPGPLGWPVLGNLAEFSSKGLPDLCQDLDAKYGTVCKFWLGSQPWVVVSDPEIARRLSLRFNTRFGFDALNMFPHKELALQNMGLFQVSDMQLWRAARKAFDSSLLPPTSLAQYTQTMDSCVLRLVSKLKGVAASGQTVDMWRELGDMTLEVVGECAYGIDFHLVADGRQCSTQQQQLGVELVEACRTIFKQFSVSKASAYVPVQLLFPTLSPVVRLVANMFPDAGLQQALQARSLVGEVSRSLIAGWKAAHSSQSDQSPEGAPSNQARPPPTHAGSGAGPTHAGSGAGSPKTQAAASVCQRSFLSALLAGRREGLGGGAEGQSVRHLDDAEMVEQALTFLLAGYETTANTLAFVIYMLAVHPGAEARLVQEVDAFGRSRALDTSDLDQFPYVGAVVKETLRLHSPAGFTTRKALHRVQVQGKTIPRQAHIHTIHTSERFWPRASEFLPERFLPEGESTLGPKTASAHMPFGTGARMCPGYKFAQQEAKIALVRLFQSFTFTLAPGMPKVPRTVTGLTTGPADGVPVVVHRRT
ncbi:MAG: hypothetical protein WDW38_007644 [Sanguina aurantia]